MNDAYPIIGGCPAVVEGAHREEFPGAGAQRPIRPLVATALRGELRGNLVVGRYELDSSQPGPPILAATFSGKELGTGATAVGDGLGGTSWERTGNWGNSDGP
eukprot:Skav231386  [mRNA]  locus=scaffold1023:139098:139568:+ [translate_table: standard]